MFEESAKGRGYRLIAAGLDDDGKAPFGNSIKWSASTVEKILNSIAPLGHYQHHKMVDGKRKPIEGLVTYNYYDEPIIDEGLWLAAKAARELNKKFDANLNRVVGQAANRGKSVSHLFSGLAKCGYCGGSMNFYQKDGTRLYCYNTKCDHWLAQKKEGKRKVGWPYNHFEKAFLAWIYQLDLPAIMESEVQAKERQQLEQEIQSLEGQKLQLVQKRTNYEAAIGQAPSPAVIAIHNANLEKVVSELAHIDEMIRNKGAKLEQLRNTARAVDESKDSIKPLIRRLQEQKDQKTLLLRSQVAHKLKSLVTTIKVYYDGIDDGDGDKVPRYFWVEFKNRDTRMVMPDKFDPYQAFDGDEIYLGDIADADVEDDE